MIYGGISAGQRGQMGKIRELTGELQFNYNTVASLKK